jgi:hypothetical protein
MKRFEFVEKTAGQVGDGTAWPMLVTLDQLAEIMYRVRDSRFVTGSADILLVAGDPPEDNHNISSFTFGAPPTALYEENSIDFLIRGYCASRQSFDPYDDDDPMDGYGENYFTANYFVADLGGTKTKVREAVSEFALWAATEDPPGTFLIGQYEQHPPDPINVYFLMTPSDMRFRTGFSYFAQDGSYALFDGHPTGISDFFFSGGSTAYVNFSGEVAWVDVDGSGNPFSPGNDLYLGIIFAQGNDPVIISTDTGELLGSAFATGYANSPLGVDFELELADDVVLSCPLYWGVTYDTGASASVYAATNFRLKATAWWPYAKPAGPVWNSATGAKL